MGYFLAKFSFKTFWTFSEITILSLSSVERKIKIFHADMTTFSYSKQLYVAPQCKTFRTHSFSLPETIHSYSSPSSFKCLQLRQVHFRLYKSSKSVLDLGTPYSSFPSPPSDKTGHGVALKEDSLFLDNYIIQIFI